MFKYVQSTLSDLIYCRRAIVQSDAYKAETRRDHLITFTAMLLPVLVGWFTTLKADNMNYEKGSKVRRRELVKK